MLAEINVGVERRPLEKLNQGYGIFNTTQITRDPFNWVNYWKCWWKRGQYLSLSPVSMGANYAILIVRFL